MKLFILGLFGILGITTFAQTTILPADIQIKTAVLAAPEMYRNGAEVLGYNAEGKLITLREGTNSLICLADDPNSEGIKVSCYSNKLEPFMNRGRQLILEGKTEEEKREIRKQEVEAGLLKMPSETAMLYVVTGLDTDYNPATGELLKSKIRYVLYKPYMTEESTGLPTKPEIPGMPWLMDAGTHRSHIMITPVSN